MVSLKMLLWRPAVPLKSAPAVMRLLPVVAVLGGTASFSFEGMITPGVELY
jgi:hypothetical protein